LSRPRQDDELPPYCYPNKQRGGWIVRSPLGEKRSKFFADRDAAIETALALGKAVDAERAAQLLEAGRPSIASAIDKMKADHLPFVGWKGGTRKNNIAKINRIRRELGNRDIARTDSAFLAKWLGEFCHTADQFNHWRWALILIWRYALEQKLVTENEAAKVLARSASLNVEVNKKVRQGLELEGYWAIREVAEPWLQLAMDISLVTLQGRSEVCHMQHANFRGDYLFVIREKTEGTSDTAFIRIPVTDSMREFRARAMALDTLDAPNLVHRRPDRQRRDWAPEGEHWAFVRPEYVTKAFKAAREKSGFYAHLKPAERPTFHEIRGLGARRCRLLGKESISIQMTMAHADESTTKTYLNGGAAALRDDQYVLVEAPLGLDEMLGIRL
jgi:enterobacteria phage integrase